MNEGCVGQIVFRTVAELRHRIHVRIWVELERRQRGCGGKCIGSTVDGGKKLLDKRILIQSA